MSTLKPWISMPAQLALLKERGLLVDDELAALDSLSRIGYYRLSGYWYPLRAIDSSQSNYHNNPIRSDRFLPNSRFEDVVNFYVFDKKLRLLAMDALERIEMAIRVDVAHVLGEKDVCAHQNPSCLHGNFAKKTIKNGINKQKTEHQVWLERYQVMMLRARRESFVAHHHQKYNGRLPIWVAIEVLDFGLLSRLFKGMTYADKNHVAHKYGLSDGDTLAKWLRSLNFIRNVSAHHSRLWNINVVEPSPRSLAWPIMKNTKPFMYFFIMRQLLKTICPNSAWHERLISLLVNCPVSSNGVLSIADFGAPTSWEQLLRQK